MLGDVYIKYMQGKVYVIRKVVPILSISWLYSKESFTSNGATYN